jgi:hypothetical protein
MSTKEKKINSAGFTMIILLISVVIVVLLSLYAYSRTMQLVQDNMKDEAPEMNVPAPTIQNYQQTLDGVKQNINQDFEKERKRIDDTQKDMAK